MPLKFRGMRKKILFEVYPKSQDLTKQWFVQFWTEIDKKPKRVKLYVANSPDAKTRTELADQIIVDIQKNGYKLHTQKLLKQETDLATLLCERFLERKPTLRRKTILCYESIFKCYDAFLKKEIDNDKNIGKNYLKTLALNGLKPATINKHRVVLSSLYAELVEDDVLPDNPFKKTKKLKNNSTGSQYFKTRQISELKKYMFNNELEFLWRAVVWIYYCFIRPAELRLTLVGDVDFDEWRIFLRKEISKNKKSEWVTIPDALKDYLIPLRLHEYPANFYLVGKDGLPAEKPVPFNWWSRHHLDMLRKLNYPSMYNFYSWKHTGVCMSYRAGLDLRQLQLQLRHHSLDMVAVYLKSMGVGDMTEARTKTFQI